MTEPKNPPAGPVPTPMHEKFRLLRQTMLAVPISFSLLVLALWKGGMFFMSNVASTARASTTDLPEALQWNSGLAAIMYLSLAVLVLSAVTFGLVADDRRRGFIGLAIAGVGVILAMQLSINAKIQTGIGFSGAPMQASDTPLAKLPPGKNPFGGAGAGKNPFGSTQRGK
jgi:uncharacterized membrane protein YkvI